MCCNSSARIYSETVRGRTNSLSRLCGSSSSRRGDCLAAAPKFSCGSCRSDTTATATICRRIVGGHAPRRTSIHTHMANQGKKSNIDASSHFMGNRRMPGPERKQHSRGDFSPAGAVSSCASHFGTPSRTSAWSLAGWSRSASQQEGCAIRGSLSPHPQQLQP